MKSKSKKKKDVIELSQEEYEALQNMANESEDYKKKWLAIHAEYENPQKPIA